MVVLSIEAEGEPVEVARAIRRLLGSDPAEQEPITPSPDTAGTCDVGSIPETPEPETGAPAAVNGEASWTEAAAADYWQELNDTARSLVTALVRAPEGSVHWTDLEREMDGLDQNRLLNTLRHMGHAARRIRGRHGQLFTNPVRNDRAGERCTVAESFAMHARALIAQPAGVAAPRPSSRRSEAWGLTQ